MHKNVVLCTHLLPDVERTCEHVVVLSGGRVVEQGRVAELTRGDQLTLEGSAQATALRQQAAANAEQRAAHAQQGKADTALRRATASCTWSKRAQWCRRTPVSSKAPGLRTAEQSDPNC